ncbi:hypothetical protein [Gimesia sp.]|uniref:hypothetical protein n=1 Tax=Gimesia sp. TaxID=2024833 RepID=UPI000C3C6B51|nr:hypothetical protein [Gimesia sp.]MAX39380.1 hypothetical protein [Gimesia sp.]HBL42833.1 hypothetical protein [Planctomycetaceae bacterium]|tara:strand:- start:9343 stop:9753 length:411 start_codon:yes stop_codon:yes gene_type:complete
MRASKLFILLLLPLTGCHSGEAGPETFTVTGEVSFSGKPVETGQIVFIPASVGTQRYAAVIENGQYTCECTPGAKQVEITAYRFDESKQEPDPAEPGKTVPARVQYIPEQFNRKTTLTAEVSSGGENHFDYRLESQ